MDIPALKTFCRVVETGNLSSAAVALHITKSVASRRIRALEDDLGVRLLHRTTRGVSTTPEGAQFYERSVRILDDLDDARQAIKGDDGALAGRLKITAPRAFSDMILAPMFADFASDHPDLEMELALSDSRTDVMAGGFDVALRIARSLDDTSFISRKLADITNVLIASPDFIKRYGMPETPDDLIKMPALYYANLSAAKQWLFQGCEADSDDIPSTGAKPASSVQSVKAARPQAVRVSGRLMTNSGIMQKEFVLRSQGVAILPRFFCHRELAAGRLTAVLPDYPVFPSSLYALWPDRRHNPVRVRRLVEMLRKRLKDDAVASVL